jgi:hypothetical protein
MKGTYQLIFLNLAVILFYYDLQKFTLTKAASINIHGIRSLLLSGASVITMLQVRASAMLLCPIVL